MAIRLPVHVVWLAPTGAAMRHAFVTSSAGRTGYCLCSRYRGRRKLRARGAAVRRGDSLATTLVECPACVRAVRLVAIGLPRADEIATRLLHRLDRFFHGES